MMVMMMAMMVTMLVMMLGNDGSLAVQLRRTISIFFARIQSIDILYDRAVSLPGLLKLVALARE